MNKRKAFLFDLNGTMIDDMQYHILAWYHILNNAGAAVTIERMTAECYGKNDELLQRLFPGRFTAEEITLMSAEKEKQYQAAFKPYISLLPGLDIFLQTAKAYRIKMAIGSAAIRSNIDFVIESLNISHYFDAIVGAEEVKESKPNPETFYTCAQQLNVHPADCIVFEDSTKGVEAALHAAMKAVAVTTLHQAHEFDQYQNVLMCVNNYTDQRLAKLFE